jgi:dihydrolipoamide dehydrogenase
MTAERNVDVAIIGAGTSGLNALSQIRKTDKSFVLINGGDLGTTCARVGCMPSKAFIQVAEDYHRLAVFDRYGVGGYQDISLNPADVLEHVRDLRDIFVDRVMGSSTDEMGDELIEGYARFVDKNVLQVGDITINAGKIVIATGSRPYLPEQWYRFGDRILTTDNFFEQESLPESLAVIGMGVIGLELGQALCRHGHKVYGIDQIEHIAGLSDPVVNQTAIDILGKEFPIWLGAPAKIDEQGDQLTISAGDRSVLVDKALVSIGRIPNLDNLGLENIGIPLDKRGLPHFNPSTMQIGDLPIFIAGDTTGDRPILHEASDEGKIAGYNAAHDQTLAFKRKSHLAITFCDPNIVTVGASWSSLVDRDDVAVGEMRFGPVGRALIMAKNKGVLRVYAEKTSGKLLGAAMIAPRGENLGHLLAWSIQQGLSVFDLLKMPFYHPVIEEALQAALYNLLVHLDPPTTPLRELDELDG